MVVIPAYEVLKEQLTGDLTRLRAADAVGYRVKAPASGKNRGVFRLVEVELILVILAHLPHIGLRGDLQEGDHARPVRLIFAPSSHQFRTVELRGADIGTFRPLVE